MENAEIARILQGLSSRRPQPAWAQFLELYSPLILQVVRWFEREDDHIANCFLFACEQLCRRRFRRLRRFDLRGVASFSTWLRAVVRNLCLDWHRKEFGRVRVFRAVARLPKLDQEAFRCVYEEGRSPEEAFLLLRPVFPGLTHTQLTESVERLRQCLTARQLWLLSLRHPVIEPLEDGGPGAADVAHQVPGVGLHPEEMAALSERRAALARALSRLSTGERLLLRLRFEEELTLEQVARVTGLADAQTVQRRVKQILGRLREEMG